MKILQHPEKKLGFQVFFFQKLKICIILLPIKKEDPSLPLTRRFECLREFITLYY